MPSTGSVPAKRPESADTYGGSRRGRPDVFVRPRQVGDRGDRAGIGYGGARRDGGRDRAPGDRLGRRRIFSIGVAWFALASAACGLAPNVDVLIVTRALQGVGGALLTPGSLAILQASFAAGDRSRAIGAWSGLGGLATAAGPLVGGELISAGSWRWIFYLNVPLSLVVLAVASRHVPETRDPAVTGRLDLAGAISGVVMLGGVTFALIEGAMLGWTSGVVLGALALAVGGAAAFVLAERRATAPMLPLALFVDRQFATTNAVTFAVYAALSGALFLLPVQLQIVSGYSPVASGLALLPVTAIMLVASARSGKLASRIGPRLQMSVGPLVVAGGLALLVRATDGSGYITFVLPAVVVFGVGLAITVAPLTATAMSSAPVAHAGTASAINNDVARVAGLIAVATLPVLAGITGASYLHPAELSAGFRSATLSRRDCAPQEGWSLRSRSSTHHVRPGARRLPRSIR